MIRFPPVSAADAHGLLCISDVINAELLWAAYRQGIFPWTDAPIGWFAPPVRGLLWPAEAHFPRNLGRLWRQAGFRITYDANFAAVIAGCRAAHAEAGEWLTPNFVRAYTELAAQGHAHSVEVWQGDALVGGTYGVQVGALFAAESMFGRVGNASRAALLALVRATALLGIDIIDVQVVTPATARVGARNVAREAYMQLLTACQQKGPLAPAPWPANLPSTWF